MAEAPTKASGSEVERPHVTSWASLLSRRCTPSGEEPGPALARAWRSPWAWLGALLGALALTALGHATPAPLAADRRAAFTRPEPRAHVADATPPPAPLPFPSLPSNGPVIGFSGPSAGTGGSSLAWVAILTALVALLASAFARL